MQQAPPTEQDTVGEVVRTVVPSAPAQDAITSAQIVLNNLLDQVRETFMFLLEAAPPLTLEGQTREPPTDTLQKWRQFRTEFENTWRSGKKKGAQTKAVEMDDDDEDEQDPEMTPETLTAPVILTGEDALKNMRNDALFRAQRIAALTQSLRDIAPLLPSTLYKAQDGKVVHMPDPHASEHFASQLEYWHKMNEAVVPLVERHSELLDECVVRVHKCSKNLVSSILTEDAEC